MKKVIRTMVNEELTKTDVKDQVKKYMDSSEFETKIAMIVKDRIKNEKALEDKVVSITKNVLTQLYKTLWVKRSFWQTPLSNKTT